MEWLAENIGSVIVFAALTAVAALIILSVVLRRKKGKTSCGCGHCDGNCGCCPMINNGKKTE